MQVHTSCAFRSYEFSRPFEPLFHNSFFPGLFLVWYNLYIESRSAAWSLDHFPTTSSAGPDLKAELLYGLLEKPGNLGFSEYRNTGQTLNK